MNTRLILNNLVKDILAFILSFTIVYLMVQYMVHFFHGHEDTLSEFTADIAASVVIIVGLQIVIGLNGRLRSVIVAIGAMAVANLLWVVETHTVPQLFPSSLLDIAYDVATILSMYAFYNVCKSCVVGHARRKDDNVR